MKPSIIALVISAVALPACSHDSGLPTPDDSGRVDGVATLDDAGLATDIAAAWIDLSPVLDAGTGASDLASPDMAASETPDFGDTDGYLPPYPKRLTCTCADKVELLLCTSLDCGSSPAKSAACAPACMIHGGVVATQCTDIDPTCTPRFPGSTFVACQCKNGNFEACAVSDCGNGQQTDAVCNFLCGPGQLIGAGAMCKDARCPH